MLKLTESPKTENTWHEVIFAKEPERSGTPEDELLRQFQGMIAEYERAQIAERCRRGKLHRAPNGRPFTSDLSGQAFWTLMQTGKRPVGLVMGNCVYHVAHRGMIQSMRQTGQNVELEQYTQALYDARELAMERMQKEAEDIGDGVLGIVEVKLKENSHGWGSHVIEFFAVGTAVVPNEHVGEGHQLPDITTVLDIND